MVKTTRSISEDIAAAEAEAPKAEETGNAANAAVSLSSVAPEVFQVFEDIPLPTTSRERESKYPWDKLAKGQSFFTPNAKIDTFNTLVSNRNKKEKKAGTTVKFTARKFTLKREGQPDVEGVMTWRVE
jgi:hypothetical protein